MKRTIKKLPFLLNIDKIICKFMYNYLAYLEINRIIQQAIPSIIPVSKIQSETVNVFQNCDITTK